MDNKGIIEKSADAWNALGRAAFVACYATDCEFVTPQEVGRGHAAVEKFWDDNEVVWPDSRVRITLLKQDGEFVFEEGVAERAPTPGRSRCPTAPRPRRAGTPCRPRSPRCSRCAAG